MQLPTLVQEFSIQGFYNDKQVVKTAGGPACCPAVLPEMIILLKIGNSGSVLNGVTSCFRHKMFIARFSYTFLL